jgi:hypothetical protein
MERVCRAQVLAMSTGKELNILSRDVVDAVLRPAPEESHSREERDRLFFEAMMRIVDRELPATATNRRESIRAIDARKPRFQKFLASGP